MGSWVNINESWYHTTGRMTTRIINTLIRHRNTPLQKGHSIAAITSKTRWPAEHAYTGVLTALVATRFNADMKSKYQALVTAGKPSKVASTAVMRKLIILANALLKANRTWVPKQA